MIETLAAGVRGVADDLSPADLLATIRSAREDENRAAAHHAATQKALESELQLDARRAKALGDLARTQTALDLLTGSRDRTG